MLRLARAHGIEVGWFELDGWRVRSIGPGAVEEAMLTDEPPTESPDLPDGAGPPYKLMCIAVTADETAALHALRDRLPGHGRGVVLASALPRGHRARDRQGARGPRGRGPARARAVELAAIGDAENDVAMLREAGRRDRDGQRHGRGAGRGAAHRTAANDRDGVALAIDALLAAR